MKVMTRTNNVFVFEVLAQAEKKGRLEGFTLTSYEEVDLKNLKILFYR